MNCTGINKQNMLKLTKGNILSLISLIIAIASFVAVTITSVKTNRITNTANLLQINASIQQRSDSVFAVKQKINEYVVALKNDANPVIDGDKGDRLDEERRTAITSLLDSYEFACSQYLNNKIDKEAFKEFYFDSIKDIKAEHGSYFGVKDGKAKYPAIDQVHREWYGS